MQSSAVAPQGDVYWHPFAFPLERLTDASRNEQDIREKLRANPFTAARPGDILLLAHPGPVLFGAIVRGSEPGDFKQMIPVEGTVNWVTLGLDHRLAGIWETWQNGAPLSPAQIRGVADAAASRGSSGIASFIGPLGDGSEPDAITRLLTDLSIHESAARVAQAARARAARLDRRVVEVEDLILGLFDPRHRDDLCHALLRLCANSPGLVSAFEEGWIDSAESPGAMEPDPAAERLLHAAADLPSGLRAATLAAKLLGKPDEREREILSGLLSGKGAGQLEIAARILRMAKEPETGSSPFGLTQTGLFRKAIETIVPADQIDAVAGRLPPEETLAEDARQFAQRWLMQRRAQTPPSRSDQPGETDYIGVQNEAAAFARLIALERTRLPMSIGIFGHWGSGKTFFLNAVEREVGKITDAPPAGFLKNVIPVKFNAWHYMEANIWASLVDVIFHALKAAQQPAAEKKDTADLFAAVTATQDDRLDAVDALAEKFSQADEAQQELLAAAETFHSRGPRGTAFLKRLGEIVLETCKTRFDRARERLKAAGEPVPSDPSGDPVETGAAVQSMVDTIRDVQEKGRLLAGQVRAQTTAPVFLFVLAAALLGLPALVAWAAHENGFAAALPGLASILATLTGAAAVVASRARKGMELLAGIADEVEKFRQTDPDLKRLSRVRAEAAAQVEAARARLEVQEGAAREALDLLQAETVASRLARLLRDRTAGDIYTRHLGVIATVRKDFELLSGLLSKRDQAAKERQSWEEHRERTLARLEAIEARHARMISASASRKARERRLLEEAVDRDRGDPGAPEAAEPALSHDLELVDYGEMLKQRLDEIRKQVGTAPEANRPVDRILLVIDDLDRCPPGKVYEVLQAVHLFLGFPLFVVLVGVDTRWMEIALIEKLGKLVDGRSGATPRDYLEKIFQIPYWTKPLDGRSSKRLVRGILKAMTPEQVTDEGAAGRDRSAGPDDEDRPGPREGKDMPDEALAGTEDDMNPSLPDSGPPDAAILDMVEPSGDETEYMARIGEFAGETPRRVLRLANVFMLLKASVSTRLEEQGLTASNFVSDPGYSRAALTQLAICTGTPEWAGLYFSVLHKVAKESGATLQTLRERLKEELEARRAPLPERARIAGLLKAYGEAEHIASIPWLEATAEDARTYTFAAPEALSRELSRTSTGGDGPPDAAEPSEDEADAAEP